MPAIILKILGPLFSGLMKVLPFFAAYKVGQKKAEADVVANSVEERQAGDKVVNKVKKSVRKKGVASHVRNNRI